MKYRFIVGPEAEDDIEESLNWYEDQQEGLGHDFRFAISRCFDLIETRPFLFPDVYRGLRKAILKRFPYSIFFLVLEERIVVTACVHQSRDPRVWKSRNLAGRKAELRKVYLEKRRAIAPAERGELSAKIAARFFDEFDLSSVNYVHCFVSLKHTGEVETRLIFERFWKEYPRVKTFAPRVNEQTGEIDSLPVDSATELVENRWKIPEPSTGDAADPEEMDLVIVPLLCFDERGYRVGYGRGFYDRFLSRCQPDCLKIGLSFFPPVEGIDDVHDGDVPLDFCITSTKIYRNTREGEG